MVRAVAVCVRAQCPKHTPFRTPSGTYSSVTHDIRTHIRARQIITQPKCDSHCASRCSRSCLRKYYGNSVVKVWCIYEGNAGRMWMRVPYPLLCVCVCVCTQWFYDSFAWRIVASRMDFWSMWRLLNESQARPYSECDLLTQVTFRCDSKKLADGCPLLVLKHRTFDTNIPNRHTHIHLARQTYRLLFLLYIYAYTHYPTPHLCK